MNKRAPLIAAGVALLLIAVTFLFLVKPKMGAVTEAQATLDKKTSQTSTLQTLLSTLRDDQANASKFHATITSVDQRIPPIMDQQNMLSLLNTAGQQAGVDHLAASFATPSILPSTGISVIPVSLTIQGRYFTIAEFFYKMETLPRAAKVTQFTLTPGGSLFSGPAPPGTMVVQATVEFYTSDTSAGPGSDPGSQPPASFNAAPASASPSPGAP